MAKTLAELETELADLERARIDVANKIADIEQKKKDAEYSLLHKSAESIRAILSKEVIDAIAPTHCRRTCNDTALDGSYMEHGHARCTRCFLLKELKSNFIDEPFKLEVSVIGINYDNDDYTRR